MKTVELQLSEDYSAPMHQYYDSMIAGETTQIKAYEKNIADCAIIAPISGLITKLHIRDQSSVNAALPLALVETGRSGDIEVYVTAKDFTDIKMGDAVEITQPASSGDIVFGGAIVEIGAEAVMRISTLGIDERAVKITIAPEYDDRASLLPGFSFDIKFFTYLEENCVIMPKPSLFKYSANKAAAGILWLDGEPADGAAEDVNMVFCAVDGVLRMKQVRLGRELRSGYVVEAGLSPGDVIVKDSSADGAKAGVKVK
jgi:hypothetical protein